ncbi:MAG: ATP-binding protein [Bacteroidota bacterium]|nr:ATP-binding protein [Bacteroidota bacterium]MDP3433227.1 ATP-binding protein [Bacteroidota bacterium]
MNRKIKILHLEDSCKDSELIQSLIENDEIEHDYFVAENEKEYNNILETENIDIILSDYSLPDFNGNDALRIAKEEYSHIPFIFVSGAMGEDRAINAMLNGATDYVLKNKLERLVPAIKRALNEQKLTTERQQAEEELKSTNRELVFQIEEKEIRQAELLVLNEMLICQYKEKEKLAIELIAAKEKAEESDRLKSSFLANMSHEIRTPLNGILGFTELLKEPDLSYKQQEYYISIIEKSGARLLNIINDIMCISKIDSGQMGVSISEINVNEQMNEIFSFFKPEAEQKGIKISCKNNLRLHETFIKTDKDKLLAILTNLVNNAIKFTNKGSIEFGFSSTGSPTVAGGSVRNKACLVSTNETIECIEFFVKDTGIGIRPEKLGIVFERFRQASESVNRKYEGAGLGLSISKAFVEILGGTIRIESEFGKGSAIYFTLPSMNLKEVKSDNKSIIWNEIIKRGMNL